MASPGLPLLLLLLAAPPLQPSWLPPPDTPEGKATITGFILSALDRATSFLKKRLPEINLDGLMEGKISFTSAQTEYDPETWEPTVKQVPVTGYTLIWDGEKITADEEGVAHLTEAQIADGDHSVQIERYAENGLPTVLRFAPDYGVTIGSAEDPDDSQDQPQGLFARIIAFFRNLFQKIAAFFGKLFNK